MNYKCKTSTTQGLLTAFDLKFPKKEWQNSIVNFTTLVSDWYQVPKETASSHSNYSDLENEYKNFHVGYASNRFIVTINGSILLWLIDVIRF
jgi:hypothetical protein